MSRIRFHGRRIHDSLSLPGESVLSQGIDSCEVRFLRTREFYAVTSRRYSERQSRLSYAVASYRSWSSQEQFSGAVRKGSSEHRFDELRLRVVREYDEMYTDP